MNPPRRVHKLLVYPDPLDNDVPDSPQWTLADMVVFIHGHLVRNSRVRIVQFDRAAFDAWRGKRTDCHRLRIEWAHAQNGVEADPREWLV